MAIRSVKAERFLVFDKEISLDLSPNLNIIIGENGCGKTSVLKAIYAAVQCFDPFPNRNPMGTMAHIFSCNSTLGSLFTADGGFLEVFDGNYHFKAELRTDSVSIGSNRNFHVKNAVFIPTTEMLSHSKGFLALNQKYKLPFDATQIDIIVNASLPETRDVPENMSGILEKISAAIDGTVVQEDDTFYVVKHDGKKIEFSLEAEGLRKLGLIWKLIRNGLLEKDTVLLWDEPEANLNPELYPLVAEILLELQSSGVQIFVATHSYNFAKYLEIRRSFEEQVQFHNLYKDETGAICSTAASTMEELKQNHIMIADEKLLDEVYDM